MKSPHLIIALLLSSVVLNAYLLLRGSQPPQPDFHKKYVTLRTNYISLAQTHKNLMEVMFENLDMKSEFGKVFDGVYSDLTDEKFQEAVRRKIVRLEMDIKEMQNE